MQPPHPQCSGHVPEGCRKSQQHSRSSKTTGTTRTVWGNLPNKHEKTSRVNTLETYTEPDNTYSREEAQLSVLSVCINTVFGLKSSEWALAVFEETLNKLFSFSPLSVTAVSIRFVSTNSVKRHFSTM